MFAFFVNQEFKGFWANRPEDSFIDATIKQMGWKAEEVEVVLYDKINEHDRVEFNEKKEVKEIRILKREEIKEFEEDGEGRPILDGKGEAVRRDKPLIIPEEKEESAWKKPEMFYSRGLHLVNTRIR